ncbi:hypothetical protein C8R45DRAFT_1094256 [Mycena sanguinolenta]|nr:hypothetical protein C8R45DRAFT_1094256 [Mycena sanguinolenta]
MPIVPNITSVSFSAIGSNYSRRPSDVPPIHITDAADDETLRKWWTVTSMVCKVILLQAGDLADWSDPVKVVNCVTWIARAKNTFRRSHRYCFSSLAEDPLAAALAQDFARLAFRHLQFKQKLSEDIRGAISPTLVDKSVGYIPSSRVEYPDDRFQLIVGNVAQRLRTGLGLGYSQV